MSITIEEELIRIRSELTSLFEIVDNLILRLQEHPVDSSSSDSDSSGYNSASNSEHERFLPPPNSLEAIDLSPVEENIAVPILARQSGRYIRDHGFERLSF